MGGPVDEEKEKQIEEARKHLANYYKGADDAIHQETSKLVNLKTTSANAKENIKVALDKLYHLADKHIHEKLQTDAMVERKKQYDNVDPGTKVFLTGLANAAKSKVKGEINKFLEQADEKILSWTGELSGHVKSAETALQEKEVPIQKEPKIYPTMKERLLGNLVNAASSKAKSEINKGIKIALEVMDEESKKLTDSVNEAQVEISNKAGKAATGIGAATMSGGQSIADVLNDDPATETAAATGPSTEEKEKEKIMRKATNLLVTTLANKGKTYIANLVDTAEGLITKETEKAMNLMNETKTEMMEKEIPLEKKRTQPTLWEKATMRAVDVASRMAKKELSEEIGQAEKYLEEGEKELASVVLGDATKQMTARNHERVNNETAALLAAQKAESKQNETVVEEEQDEAVCKLVENLPGCHALSFMATYDEKYSVEQYRKGMNEFYGLLPIIATLVQMDSSSMPDLVQCIPKFREETCNIMSPKCNAQCEPQLPCVSSCRGLGQCQKWLDSKLLGSMLKGGEHYEIVETVTHDKDMLAIIEAIATKFTSKCGADNVYSSELKNTNKCSSAQDTPVKKCK